MSVGVERFEIWCKKKMCKNVQLACYKGNAEEVFAVYD